MKCPYCKESIEKVNVAEGKYFVESLNNPDMGKKFAKFSIAYLR
jgi:hypothetical protein